MSHLTPEQLSAHLDRADGDAERAAAERHLAECAECRDALAELAALDATLGEALEHDPGEAYFAGFAGRVEDRLRAQGLRGAQARGAEESEHRWMAWLRSPRRLAWAGAALAVLAGVAVVLVTSREERMGALDESRLAKRSGERVAEEPALEPVAPPPGATGEAPAEGLARGTQQAGPSGRARDMAAASPAGRATPSGAAGGTSPFATAPASGGAPAAGAGRAPSAQGRAEAPAPAGVATPERLMEVRRDASGNYVPVNPPADLQRFAPPPAAAPAPAPGQPMRVPKQGFARPLGAQPRDAREGAAAGSVALPGEIELCGTVSSGDSVALAGASVVLAGLDRVAFTGSDGRFCMSAPAGDHELTVAAVGFASQRVQVHVGGEHAEVKIALTAVSVLGGAAKPTGTSRLAAPAASGADPFAALPDSTRLAVREAQRLSAAAAALQSATAEERAAALWERVLAEVPADGAAADVARYHVAEARYGAWRAGATPARAAAATRALDAFLASAPAGAQRDLAARWRATLPR